MVEPGHHCGGLAEIPLEMDHPHALILFSELFEDPIGRIGAAVVDKDQLPSDANFGEFAAYPLTDFDERRGFIKDWYNDRDIDDFLRPWRPIFKKFCHLSPAFARSLNFVVSDLEGSVVNGNRSAVTAPTLNVRRSTGESGRVIRGKAGRIA